MKISHFLVPTIALVTVTTAHAGSIISGAWLPTGCSTKPDVPKIDTSSAQTFNKSVDALNKYRPAIKAYQDCLITEANADIQTITKSAKAAQQEYLDANDALVEEVKAAEKKLKGGKTDQQAVPYSTQKLIEEAGDYEAKLRGQAARPR